MKWSWKIGEFAGIGVYVHATFLLIIAWVALSHWREGDELAVIAEGVLFVLAIFGCVVLHEFGHALMARRFGVRTLDITLLPIGGVARLERMPDKPMQEFWVALAEGQYLPVVFGTAELGPLVIWYGDLEESEEDDGDTFYFGKQIAWLCHGPVDELIETSRMSDEAYDALGVHFGKEQMMDLVFTIGNYVMLGWAVATFGIPVEDGVDPIGFDLKRRSGGALESTSRPFERD